MAERSAIGAGGRGDAGSIDRPWAVGGGAMIIMVDEVVDVGDFVGIRGWSVGEGELAVEVDGSATYGVQPMGARPDVDAALHLAPGTAIGFAALLPAPPAGGFRIRCSPAAGEPELMPLPEAVADSGAGLAKVRRRYLDECPAAASASAASRGFIEAAQLSTAIDRSLVVGWCALAPGASAWFVDENGRAHEMTAAGSVRLPRPDVDRVVGASLAWANPRPGVIILIDGVEVGSTLRLLALEGGRIVELARAQVAEASSDPIGLARVLFDLPVGRGRDSSWMDEIAMPLIEPLLAARARSWERAEVVVREFGQRPERVDVSVVVPLYGRKDFVETQVQALAQDPGFARRAELVYVIDDPDLLDPVAADLAWLARLYPLPMRSVWGGCNRGFSGANNLGVAHARGDTLIFLNSDAFPREPGWWDAMRGILSERPDVGAVGARLLYPDGSLQHAGMAFRWRDDLRIWTNHHPLMGLDPALDERVGPSKVPAVTGACLALRRSDFDAVGGWDTGYLIGDFEDSDLCLKLRERGKEIWYHPGVTLTHLERQSFKDLGDPGFRQSVVIYNARRHQDRWARFFDLREGAP